jgi:hypothetical protein
MVALESIKDERLVRFWNLEIGEASAVGEVKLGLHRVHAQAWELAVHLDIYRLIWLDSDDELIARDASKDSRDDVLELNSDLRLLFVESYIIMVREQNSCEAQIKTHLCPP